MLDRLLTDAQRAQLDEVPFIMDKLVDKRKRVEGITIDRPGTWRRDDGLLCIPHDKGWTLQVSIVDVPAFVPKDSALDKRARRLGGAVILPRGLDRVMMLPDKLTEQIGFKEGRLRPAVTVEMEIDRKGNLSDQRIYRSVFKTLKTCDYKVIDAEAGKGSDFLARWMDCATAIRRNRFATFESEVEKGLTALRLAKPAAIPVPAIELSRDMIEEFMLVTNSCLSTYLRKSDVPALYRASHAVVNGREESANAAGNLKSWFDNLCNRISDRLTEKLPPCARATSPLMTYLDLITLRSVADHVSSGRMAYTPDELAEIGERQAKMLAARQEHAASIAKDMKAILLHMIATTEDVESFRPLNVDEIGQVMRLSLDNDMPNTGLNFLMASRLRGRNFDAELLGQLLVRLENRDDPKWAILKKAARTHVIEFPKNGREALHLLRAKGYEARFGDGPDQNHPTLAVKMPDGCHRRDRHASVEAEAGATAAVKRWWLAFLDGRLEEIKPAIADPESAQRSQRSVAPYHTHREAERAHKLSEEANRRFDGRRQLPPATDSAALLDSLLDRHGWQKPEMVAARLCYYERHVGIAALRVNGPDGLCVTSVGTGTGRTAARNAAAADMLTQLEATFPAKFGRLARQIAAQSVPNPNPNPTAAPVPNSLKIA